MYRFRWINFYSFLTISYFIVAHCTFTTNLSSKLKSQFQVIFWEDSFLSTWVHFKLVFYCRTLRTFCSLMDGGMPAFTITLLTKKFPISFCKHLVYCKIFLFCQKDSFTFLFHMPFDTSSMISSLILLNKSFLHLDAHNAS